MKGSRTIFALAAIVLILGASTLWAQNEYSKPLDKTISPGRATVKYDTYVYTFMSDNYLEVRLEKIDRTHVRLNVKQVSEVKPYESVFVEWGGFGMQELNIGGSPNGDTFILNTETGYAEK